MYLRNEKYGGRFRVCYNNTKRRRSGELTAAVRIIYEEKSMDISSLILFEDDSMIAVRKPAGLACESRRFTEPDLVSYLRSYLGAGGAGRAENSGRTDNAGRTENSGRTDNAGRADTCAAPAVHMVNRLDQVVEGICLFAKNSGSAAALSRQLSGGGMKKIYRAKTGGCIFEKPMNQRVTLTDYLLRDGRNNVTRVVPKETRGAKKASLIWERTGKEELLIELLTGRHHQIRAQLSHAGMPILGDVKYGGEAPRAKGTIALCASEIRFRHPVSGAEMCISVRPESPYGWEDPPRSGR